MLLGEGNIIADHHISIWFRKRGEWGKTCWFLWSTTIRNWFGRVFPLPALEWVQMAMHAQTPQRYQFRNGFYEKCRFVGCGPIGCGSDRLKFLFRGPWPAQVWDGRWNFWDVLLRWRIPFQVWKTKMSVIQLKIENIPTHALNIKCLDFQMRRRPFWLPNQLSRYNYHWTETP